MIALKVIHRTILYYLKSTGSRCEVAPKGIYIIPVNSVIYFSNEKGAVFLTQASAKYS